MYRKNPEGTCPECRKTDQQNVVNSRWYETKQDRTDVECLPFGKRSCDWNSRVQVLSLKAHTNSMPLLSSLRVVSKLTDKHIPNGNESEINVQIRQYFATRQVVLTDNSRERTDP